MGFGVGSGGVADEFVSGRELSSAFYAEVVSPLLGHADRFGRPLPSRMRALYRV